MVKIKAVYPFNYYLLRNIKILIGNTIIATVGHNQITELDDTHKGRTLTFKLDYHKAEIEVPKTEGDVYIIVYFDFRNYFPFNITDIAFSNALKAKIVTKEEFENFDVNFYKTTSGKKIEFNFQFFYSLILGILFSISFIAIPFFAKLSEQDKNFIELIGILTLIGFIIQIFQLKKTKQSQYYIKILSFGILALILSIFIQLNFILKTIMAVLALSLILISIDKLTIKP